MPVSFKKAQETLDAAVIYSDVTEIEKYIDEHLLNPEWLRTNILWDNQKGYYWKFRLEIKILERTKNQIKNDYSWVGWKEVLFQTEKEPDDIVESDVVLLYPNPEEVILWPKVKE